MEEDKNISSIEENKKMSSIEEVTESEQQEYEDVEEIKDTRNGKEKLYDKIPLTYKQVDILTKVLIGALVSIMLYFVVTSKIWG